MCELNLAARRHKPFRRASKPSSAEIRTANILNRQFSADRPFEKWVTDITYIQTAEGWVYLAAIIDLYSRAVVGWSLGKSLSTELPLKALESAFRKYRPPKGLLHHSDRGCQYTSDLYQKALNHMGFVGSVSRPGNCWDNAVAESFFSTIKAELINRYHWQNESTLRDSLFDYIEVFYNRERIHSSLDYETPANRLDNFKQVG